MESEELNVTSYYYDSIELLRKNGNIILHSQFVTPTSDEEAYVLELLRKEYQKEAITFPGELSSFDGAAALWGARTLFIASQLLLLRDIPELSFTELLPEFTGEINEGSIISCDLCLRFLPQIIAQAEDIDTYDGLIPQLENLLASWPYSGIGRRLLNSEQKTVDYSALTSKAMQLLVVDRVVKRKVQHSIPNEIKQIVKPFINIELND